MSKAEPSIPDLSTKALRAFVALATTGTLAGAAKLLNRSESAISLQVNGLEKIVRRPLFERTGRKLRLSSFGTRFLSQAEDILARIDAARLSALQAPAAGPMRVGVVQDLLDPCMPTVLQGLQVDGPVRPVQLVAGTSAQLSALLGEEQIDIAVIARRFVEPDTVASFPMRWIASTSYAPPDPLSLAAVSPPCPFNEAAARALSQAGLRHEVTFESPSLDAVCRAVALGAGVMCRTALALRPGLVEVAAQDNLPPLPSISYVIDLKRGPDEAAKSLSAALRARLQMLAPKTGCGAIDEGAHPQQPSSGPQV